MGGNITTEEQQNNPAIQGFLDLPNYHHAEASVDNNVLSDVNDLINDLGHPTASYHEAIERPLEVCSPRGQLMGTHQSLHQRLARQDAQLARQTHYIGSMHSWAKRATETIRGIESHYEEVEAIASAASQQAAANRAQLEQVSAENEINQRTITNLQAIVANLADQVRCLSEQQDTPAGTTNQAVHQRKRARQEFSGFGIERLGSSEEIFETMPVGAVPQVSSSDCNLRPASDLHDQQQQQPQQQLVNKPDMSSAGVRHHASNPNKAQKLTSYAEEGPSPTA